MLKAVATHQHGRRPCCLQAFFTTHIVELRILSARGGVVGILRVSAAAVRPGVRRLLASADGHADDGVFQHTALLGADLPTDLSSDLRQTSQVRLAQTQIHTKIPVSAQTNLSAIFTTHGSRYMVTRKRFLRAHLCVPVKSDARPAHSLALSLRDVCALYGGAVRLSFCIQFVK